MVKRAKRAKRKIPRNAVEMLTGACEDLSKEWMRSAAEIFKEFLELMDRYSDYFFSKPWPEEFDIKKSTAFTYEDLHFLNESEDEGDFHDRYVTLLLKKNMNLEVGFQGTFGMLWTQKAFNEEFVRPGYKPVWEAFDSLAQKNEDSRTVLDKLKEQFSVRLIHDSLVDLLDHNYPDVPKERLIEGMFELLHRDEGVPACRDFLCSWYRRQKCPPSTASQG